jgi:peptide/nickel transport system substrate-binding protein
VWPALGLAVLVGAGCSRDRAGSATDLSTYTVLLDAQDWTPLVARDRGPKFLVFLELATPNEYGSLEGRLAKSWEHSPDYDEWTIHLRTDVTWHDGVPVTAHDVKFTVDLWNHPDVLDRDNIIESVEVVDDSTFVMRYKPGSAWHTYWYPGYWSVFYPKHLLENLDPAKFHQWEFWTQPVGNGPFRYVRHTPNTLVEFEANPDFYLGRPKIDRLVIKFGPESITELLAGNVDAMNLENGIAVERIKDDPRFEIYYEAWDDISAVVALFYNHRNPLFTDARVRRAMTHAINRQELKRVLNQWQDLPVLDIPFTESQYWKGELLEPLPYDQDLARRLLEEAGWRDSDGDGIREQDGAEFKFAMIVENRYQPVAIYVQHKLGEVGIRVEITMLDRSVLQERTDAAEFEVAMNYFWVSPDDPDAGLDIVFGENSLIGYRNPRVVELVNNALEATAPQSLDAIYEELAPIIQEDQPVTFLILGTEIYAAHRGVKGLSSPFRANPLWSAGHLWIEEH